MIVREGPALAPEEAARRIAAGVDPIWISSPGHGNGEVDLGFDAVAADPATVVTGDSLETLEKEWRAARRAWSTPGTAPGEEIPIAVGWLSYDLARSWIPLGGGAGSSPGPAATPIEFRFFDAVWVRRTGQGTARILARDETAAERLATRLGREPPRLARPRLGPLTAAASSPVQARARHAAAVATIKQYLLDGDVYQVNLARRLIAPVGAGDPLWISTTLRSWAPAPHAVWMGSRSPATDLDAPIDRYVVGNSPERFLRVSTTGMIETQPIKGTRPRGADSRADASSRLALETSAKDRAEHVMIVDLERNDLGRVCQTGSVTVDGLLQVMELPTVFHLVSTVRGLLRPEVGLAELVMATFPGGSVTGAPKRRAMQIIEELEPVRRGVYTGATGWLGGAGDLDLAVAIRTAVVASGQLTLFVGGGIVADSHPESEWAETELKARAFSQLCQS